MFEKRFQCNCGNKYGSYGLASQYNKTCDQSCPKNENEICGGENANSIYKNF